MAVDVVTTRMPEGLKERLQEAAARAGSSLNAEIVERLEASLATRPAERSKSVALPPEMTTPKALAAGFQLPTAGDLAKVKPDPRKR